MVGGVIDLTLLGLGALLLAALISYQPRDVPGLVPIIANSATGSHASHNLIGPVGAIVAGFFYFLVGAGSYVVAAELLGYGGAKLLDPGLRIARRVPWAIGAVLSFACIADLQHVFLTDWTKTMGIPGRGDGSGIGSGGFCTGRWGGSARASCWSCCTSAAW